MVIWEVPVPVTWPLVTSIVSIVISSEVFLTVMFPVWTVTLSLKFKIILASLATSVALSAGDDDDKVGSILSTVVKLRAVVLLIPA